MAFEVGNPTGSQLAQSMSAAMREFLDDEGSRYTMLYRKYLGVPPITVPESSVEYPAATPGSSLDRVLKSGKLRLGFYRRAPYYYAASNGQLEGFEYELAPRLVEKMSAHYGVPLAVEWVEETPAAPQGGGHENLDLFPQFHEGLQAGRYDMVFSGMISEEGRPVVTTVPTMRVFENLIYTGLGDQDLSPLVGASRGAILRRIAEMGEVALTSTAGGPSEECSRQLVEEIQNEGGKVTADTATVSELQELVLGKQVHFVLGDGIALSYLANKRGFQGSNLNVDMCPEKAAWICPFTLPD